MQEPDARTEDAVAEALDRLIAAYPAQKWTPGLRREYRRVLSAIRRPELIELTVDAAIDGNATNFAPPVGVIVSCGAAVVREQRSSEPAPARPVDLPIDEAALLDARSARALVLRGETDLFTLEEIDGQIERITARLAATAARACPRCGQEVGVPCRRPDGRDTWAHAERVLGPVMHEPDGTPRLEPPTDPSGEPQAGREILDVVVAGLRRTTAMPAPEPGDADHPDVLEVDEAEQRQEEER